MLLSFLCYLDKMSFSLLPDTVFSAVHDFNEGRPFLFPLLPDINIRLELRMQAADIAYYAKDTISVHSVFLMHHPGGLWDRAIEWHEILQEGSDVEAIDQDREDLEGATEDFRALSREARMKISCRTNALRPGPDQPRNRNLFNVPTTLGSDFGQICRDKFPSPPNPDFEYYFSLTFPTRVSRNITLQKSRSSRKRPKRRSTPRPQH